MPSSSPTTPPSMPNHLRGCSWKYILSLSYDETQRKRRSRTLLPTALFFSESLKRVHGTAHKNKNTNERRNQEAETHRSGRLRRLSMAPPPPPVVPASPGAQYAPQFLSTVLSQRGPEALPYTEDVKWLIRQHLVALAESFPSLHPKASAFTHNDGRTVNLLQAEGTIPIMSQGTVYNIPAMIWLLDALPFLYHQPLFNSSTLHGRNLVDILLSGLVSYVLDLQESLLLGAVTNPKHDRHGAAGAKHHHHRRDVARRYIIDVKKGRMRIRMKVALALGVVVLCVGVGTAVLRFVERLGWLDSFYLSVMSVTTIGYGDRAFKTMPGRLFASLWLLVSTLAVARAFLYLAEARIDKRHRKIAKWVLTTVTPSAELFPTYSTVEYLLSRNPTSHSGFGLSPSSTTSLLSSSVSSLGSSLSST